MIGRAAEILEISVDLPTLGNPTSPTSAMSFSSRNSSRSSPSRPGSCSRGTWWVARAKEAFPRPPFPPAAASNR